jgi:hypothetical protein
MKQLFFYSLLLMLITTSCEKEIEGSDTRIKIFEWPEGTSDYAPYTIGSSFKYDYSSTNPAATDVVTLTVTKDTIINNLKYYKLQSDKPNLVASYFVNDNNGNVTEITYDLNFLGLITVPVLTENTLKQNATVNTSWNDPDVNLVWYNIPVNVKFAHTMIQKDFIKEVLSINYSNSVAVREIVDINLPQGVQFPAGVPSSIQYDNLYAKGVGLIQRNVSLGTVQKIKSYNVVK